MQFAGVGLEGSPYSDLDPYWSAQTIWGALRTLAVRRCAPAFPVYPLARQRLLASRLQEMGVRAVLPLYSFLTSA